MLSIDNEIRSVIIVNNKENTLISKTQKDVANLISPSEEEELAMDLQKIKQFNEKFDGALGKTTCLHMIRDRVHQLVWFVQDLIIYVTLKSTLEDYQIEEIAKKVQDVINDTTRVFQAEGPSQFRRS